TAKRREPSEGRRWACGPGAAVKSFLSFLTSWSGWQIICCFIGLLVCVAPTPNWTQPFWGFSGGFYQQWRPPYTIAEVVLGSPADVAGLREDDQIFGVDGKPVRFGQDFKAILRDVPAGGEIKFGIKRHGQDMTVRGQGVEPQL